MGISLFWNIFFVTAVCIGFFFGLVLLSQFLLKKQKSQLFLSLFILVFSYILLNNLVYWNELINKYPGFLFTTISTRYLLAPLFYLFYKSYTAKPPKLLDLWHFIPFVILTMGLIDLLSIAPESRVSAITEASEEQKASFLSYLTMINWGLSFQLIAYPLWIIWQLYQQNKSLNDPDRKLNETQYKWLKFLNFLFLLYGLLMFLYFVMLHFQVGGIEKDYYISFVMCIAIYGISYVAIINPSLLNGADFINKIDTIKYKKAKLEDERLSDIIRKLNALMNTEKPYLDADFTLNALAKQINIPKHHISQALNQKSEQSFYTYINSLRITHALKLLDKKSEGHNIKTIMYESGFNNRVSFNNNFKKITGVTASQYLKQNL